jgi:hypothetical protein
MAKILVIMERLKPDNAEEKVRTEGHDGCRSLRDTNRLPAMVPTVPAIISEMAEGSRPARVA